MLDTKSKNSRKAGIFIIILILAICSGAMLTTYQEMDRALDNRKNTTSGVLKEYTFDDMGYKLGAGNMVLYAQTTDDESDEVKATENSSGFGLLKKYIDYAVFDKEGALLSDTEEETAKKLLSGDDEYAFKAEYKYSEDGDLSELSVTGTYLSRSEQYQREVNFAASVENTYYDYALGNPEDVTIIYGMSQENLDLYIEETRSDYENFDHGSLVYGTDFRSYCVVFFCVIFALSLILPSFGIIGVRGGWIFNLPLELSLLILCCSPLGVEVCANVVWHSIKDGVFVGEGPVSVLLNFAMWFAVGFVIFACGSSLRQIFTMGKEYWKERVLTVKLFRMFFRGSGSTKEKLVGGLKNIWNRIRSYGSKVYNEFQHIDFRENTNKMILKAVLINAGILFLVIMLWYYGTVALVIYSVLLFLILRKYMNDVQEKYKLLLDATNQLADGNLDTEISGDMGIFNPIRDELKKVQEGFKVAVDKEVKNERMKTELVTNVSHDLRTPLTAIITYTDLLKNETDEEKRKEYVDVLERKSLRLKVLIEDLFEISKAASKSIVMNYMDVDIVGLIKQAGLENEEKIKAADLDFRWNLPEEKVVMRLDSQKTYRIFENLIVNITKYAMPHTRVYIDMEATEQDVSISMKNISAEELNFNVDEITDRFVRGDSARNTEGSGLGLAIAKSFTELQGGTLKIETEADLFKVMLNWGRSKL